MEVLVTRIQIALTGLMTLVVASKVEILPKSVVSLVLSHQATLFTAVMQLMDYRVVVGAASSQGRVLVEKLVTAILAEDFAADY